MTVTETVLSACPTGIAARVLKCCNATVLNMGKRGEIKFEKTSTGRFLWHVAEYLERTGQMRGVTHALSRGYDKAPAADKAKGA